MHIITLTTDFGTRDWFVGTMKGIVLGINPRAVIVDLTHEIPPGDIRSGAFVLMAAYRYFPKGTVHVAVVDPGVGSKRIAIAVQTSNYFFVGPDNGVLSWALEKEKLKSIQRLENPKYFLKNISRTFHGRDIFAPTAAHLSRGLSLRLLGRELKNHVRIPRPQPTKNSGKVRQESARLTTICGEIVYIDRFGNAITNIHADQIPLRGKMVCEVSGKRKVRCALAGFYGAVPVKSPVAVIGSSGLLEIAVNGGSAAQQFGIEAGDTAFVSFPSRISSPAAGR